MELNPPAEKVVRAPATLTNRAAWFLIWALSLATMVSYVDRQILTLLFTPIKADLGLSDTEVSLLVGLAFVACYSVFGLFSGWLADRHSRKGLVSIGIVFWSAATAACGLANSFTGLFAARMAVGVGESTLSPAAMSMVTDAFPREKLARAMSVYTGATFVGMGMAMVLGGLGIQAANYLVAHGYTIFEGLKPWQVSFVLTGVIGGLAVIPMLLSQEPPRGHLPVPAAQPMMAAVPASTIKFTPFLKANLATFGLIWLGYSLNAMSGVGALSWTPTYFIRLFHMTPTQIGMIYGLIVSVVGLAGVLLGPSVFTWLNKKGMRDGYVVFPMVCMAVGGCISVVAFSMPNATVALLLIGLKQLIMSLPMPIMAMSMQIIAAPSLRGRFSAIYLFMGNIVAAAAGPVVVAVITDYIFHDEAKIGLSIIANTVVLVPLAALCLWLAVRPYRASLADADAGFVRAY